MTRAAYVVESITSNSLRALNYAPVTSALRKGTSTEVVLLGSLLAAIGPAYGSVFVRYDCDPGYGEELLSQSDMFAAEPAGRFIRGDALPKLDRQRIYRGQVLIAGAGTLGENELYGRSILADGRLVGKIVGPHCMTLTFSEPESDFALYTYGFLLTKTGISLLRSTSFGTKILGLRKDLLQDIPIPRPENEIVRRVANLIRTAVREREKYAVSLTAARAIIEALSEFQDAKEMCAERRARCVAWTGAMPTLTAWTYSSAGEALPYLRKRWSATLGDVVGHDGIFRGQRFTRINCDAPYGVDLLSQRDVFLIRPVPRRIVDPGTPRSGLLIKDEMLLIGGHGSLGEGEIFGRVAYASQDLIGNALTEDILRIMPHSHHIPTAFTFLSTIVGLRLLRSTAVGTKLMSLRPDLLRTLPFPDVDEDQMREISRHFHSAMVARANGNLAEREAIQLIEDQVIPAWLN